MRHLPLTTELIGLARRVVWFEEPDQVLVDPVRFVAYAMTYGTHEDMKIIRQYFTDEDLQEALSQAPAGIFDGRSWSYWNLKMGRYPTPPLPTREFPQP